jgi:hypothetical protein
MRCGVLLSGGSYLRENRLRPLVPWQSYYLPTKDFGIHQN